MRILVVHHQTKTKILKLTILDSNKCSSPFRETFVINEKKALKLTQPFVQSSQSVSLKSEIFSGSKKIPPAF
jgi:hypothetical protein